ncbi:MAG: hypothetical protein MZV70_33075 [Desulfobacterales bacterium]|nr:hypothetical protein [Desulfobacterales bacterium]
MQARRMSSGAGRVSRFLDGPLKQAQRPRSPGSSNRLQDQKDLVSSCPCGIHHPFPRQRRLRPSPPEAWRRSVSPGAAPIPGRAFRKSRLPLEIAAATSSVEDGRAPPRGRPDSTGPENAK